MKILYAAGNNENAKIQLTRFLNKMSGKPYTIKVAAYIKSSPATNVDWTLDCLLNIFKPEHISLNNDNYDIYFDQVRKYAPDLIISDLEYFTSHIANVLGIEIWQYSSSLLNFALTNDYKYNLGVFSQYAYAFNKNPVWTQKIINIIDNSSKNLVYSHFGDVSNSPPLKSNFQWVRPHHLLGKEYKPCQHNLVGAGLHNNRKVISLLQKYSDSVYFSNIYYEKYNNLIIKDLKNEEEYFCNLKNSNLFVSGGQSSFIADAFYNKKYSVIIPDTNDTECIVNSCVANKTQTSSIMYQITDILPKEIEIVPELKKEIKFIDEIIEEL